MQYSHSRVECFKGCPYRYKLRYIDKVKTLPDYEANNALLVGNLLHKAVEAGIDEARKEYFSLFPVVTDDNVDEVIKAENMAEKVHDLLDGKPVAYEYKLSTKDFIGYIDCVEILKDGTFALYDFKYSNNVSNYDKSAQIHLYKYFFEKQTKEKVSKIAYIMVPKINKTRKYGENVNQFRRELLHELAGKEPFIHNVRYNQEKVIQWLFDLKACMEATEWPKNETRLCYYCDYFDYCQKGLDYVITRK